MATSRINITALYDRSIWAACVGAGCDLPNPSFGFRRWHDYPPAYFSILCRLTNRGATSLVRRLYRYPTYKDPRFQFLLRPVNVWEARYH